MFTGLSNVPNYRPANTWQAVSMPLTGARIFSYQMLFIQDKRIWLYRCFLLRAILGRGYDIVVWPAQCGHGLGAFFPPSHVRRQELEAFELIALQTKVLVQDAIKSAT